MFGWFNKKMAQVNASAYRKEMENFLHSLKAMDAEYLSSLVAKTSSAAGEVQVAYTCDLFFPFPNVRKHPSMDIVLYEQIGKAKKRKDTLSADALSVWLHTVRGATYPVLFELSKEIWCELGRAAEGEIHYPAKFEP